MRQDLSERLLFLRAFVAHPRLVGAVLPTSRWAVRDMLDLADVPGADLVVELGAGTGVYTGEILARAGKQARVLALEIDPRLAGLLRQRWSDPRLSVVCDSAENLSDHLGGASVDVLVSGLPFTSLPAEVRARILEEMPRALSPRGVALVLQYSPLIQAELRKRFPSVRRRISVRNIPPAFLFACSFDRAAGSPDPGRGTRDVA
jgi:phospholipid N-methyltransferase